MQSADQNGRQVYGKVGEMRAIPWPSTQPLRGWSKQCADRDYMDVCTRYSIPGQKFCENHIDKLPEIVCLCGSTRYWETFRDVGLDLTMAGIIVLSIGVHTADSKLFAHPDSEQGKAQKKLLDDLHKKKIDICSEVLVLNVDGYIGDSTRGEIEHAIRIGKPVKWLENPNGQTI